MVKLLLNSGSGLIGYGTDLIQVLNNANSKLKILNVEEQDLKLKFNLEQKRSAIIVNEINGVDQVLAYLFLSPELDESRNILVAQSIFPDLINIMNIFLKSPFFDMLPHPVYFVNMINKSVLADSIVRDFSLLHASGFNYVELYQNNIIDIANSSKDLNQIVKNIYDDVGLEKKFFEINNTEKILKIKVPVDILLNSNQNDFNGSNEKFFWTEILLVSIIAIKNGYKLNVSEFENFILDFQFLFSDNSKKMLRCKALLNYFNKLKYKMNYYEL
jgi:hypothetical protein